MGGAGAEPAGQPGSRLTQRVVPIVTSADTSTVIDDTARHSSGGGRLALILLAALGATFALPRVQGSDGLQLAFGGAIALLGLWVVGLRLAGRPLGVERWLQRPHYVQSGVQFGVYGYWAFYWPQVAAQAPLILAQIVFLMLFEACVSWSLGRRYRLGFSAAPIVGSINLFLWFRDEAFVFQLALVAVAYLSKEFVKWQREGRRVHIFNPSAIVLALAGLTMIFTGTAHHAWAAEISTALGKPPYAYENIFLMGLIVLSFVPSVLVTVSATLTLLGLGGIYLQVTGIWRFVDTGIPIAVWLGMTLLATDPASTPRKGLGKVLFGILYGASVFVIYGILRGLERPAGPGDPGLHVSYFDKLLFLPILNLSVRWIDRLAGWAQARLDGLWPAALKNPRLHILVWIGVFVAVRGWLVDHPGRRIEFWEQACERHPDRACPILLERYTFDCHANAIGEACHNAGVMQRGDPTRATALFTAGCQHGIGRACVQAAQLATTPEVGAPLVERACALGDHAGCEQLAQYGLAALSGGEHALAARVLAPACEGDIGPACANLAVLLHRGQGVPRDPARAEALRVKACGLGVEQACRWR